MDNQQWIKDLFTFAKSVPEIPDDERGKEFVAVCGVCGGKLVAIRNEYNGHLWAKCEGCKVSIME